MIIMKKLLVACLVVLITVLPALADPSFIEGGEDECEGVVPQGIAMSDEELLETTGEFWWFLVFAVVIGGGRAVYENWFDEDYGIDKDDGKEIAGTALAAGVAGSCWATALAVTALITK